MDAADILDQPYELVELADDRLVARREATARLGDAGQSILIAKTYRLGGGRRDPSLTQVVSLENRSPSRLVGRFALEWNLTMSGGGGNPDAYYEIGASEEIRHNSRGTAEGVGRIVSGNRFIGIRVDDGAVAARRCLVVPDRHDLEL